MQHNIYVSAHVLLHQTYSSLMPIDNMIPFEYSSVQKILLEVIYRWEFEESKSHKPNFFKKLKRLEKEHRVGDHELLKEFLENPLVLRWFCDKVRMESFKTLHQTGI